MNGDGYLPPTPSTTSTIISEHIPPATLSGPVPDTASLDHSASLEEAAAALETVYRRIQQVRQNLLDTVDSFPTLNARRQLQEGNTIGPNHEAITLIDGLADDMVSVGDDYPGVRPGIISVGMMEERLREIEARIESDLRAPDRHRTARVPNTLVQTNSVPSTNSPSPISHRQYIVSRRSQLEILLSRRRGVDDPSTSIGRRVAAREAAGSNAMQTSTFRAPSRLDANPVSSPPLEREIDNFYSITRLRRSEVTPVTPADIARLPELTRGDGTADINTSRRGSYTPGVYTGIGVNSASEYRRRRVYGTSSVQSPLSAQSSERLSLLSNISVQNLPNPDSPGDPRPLIFDEPTSYIPEDNAVQQPSGNRDEPTLDNNEERSYIIRRRFNADGEEHVHPINLEWADEEPSSWSQLGTTRHDNMAYDYSGLHPGGAVLRRQSQREAIRIRNVSEAPQRRRGWARLDSDGDEIPSDEEELLERARMEHRIRALSRTRGPISGPPDNIDTRPALLYAPTTVLSEDENDIHPDNVPLVRLNRQGPRLVYGNLAGLAEFVTRTTSSPAQPVFESPPISAFYPDPLPMPLEKMGWSSNKSGLPRAPRIPKHASFAGR